MIAAKRVSDVRSVAMLSVVGLASFLNPATQAVLIAALVVSVVVVFMRPGILTYAVRAPVLRRYAALSDSRDVYVALSKPRVFGAELALSLLAWLAEAVGAWLIFNAVPLSDVTLRDPG